MSPTLTSPGNGGVPSGYNYSWSNGATTSSIIVTAILPTPNQYTVTIGDGCTIPGASAVFTVNVNPLPNGTFAANSTTACAPAPLTFSANTTGGVTDTYVWELDQKDIMGTTNPVSYNFPTAGTFSVDLHITSSLGCIRTVSMPNYITIYKTQGLLFP